MRWTCEVTAVMKNAHCKADTFDHGSSEKWEQGSKEKSDTFFDFDLLCIGRIQ